MFSVEEVELAMQQAGQKDEGVVTVLKLVERGAREVERWSIALGAQHVCDAWLDSCGQWVAGVSATLVSALSYGDGPERRVALELAAEESSMRLLMGLEREGRETVAVLRNLDSKAARAASELAARIEMVDRMLRSPVAP